MSRLQSFFNWLLPPERDDTTGVDTEYLLERQEQYQHISVTDADPERCRCDLCGRLFDLEDFPDLVAHVAGHDEQGAAEIDPFERGQVEATADYAFIEAAEDLEPEEVKA